MRQHFLPGLYSLTTIPIAITSISVFSILILPQPAKAQNCGTKDGITLPCWRDYLGDGEGDESLPFYPYAKRENGCSIPGAKPGTYDNFANAGYNFSFKSVCNAHDRCYYKLGTTPNQCNIEAYTVDLLKVCRDGALQPLTARDVLTGGTLRGAAIQKCIAQAGIMSNAVMTTQYQYHTEAQQAQRAYLARVASFTNELVVEAELTDVTTTASSFRVRNRWNPYCLASIGNSKEIDNRVGMGTCDSSNSIWRWDGQQLRNGWNPNCLGSIGNSKEIDNRVVMGSCGQSNAVWQWDGQQIRNGWNPYCLGSIGNSKTVDNRVVMGSCGQSNAHWYTERIQ